MKRSLLSVVVAGAMVVAGFAADTPVRAATYTKVVRYGPFTIPAATEAGPGVLPNRLKVAVQRPCIDCYVTSVQPDLVDANGVTANIATGPMLHHAVLTSQWRPDATCGNAWLGLAGERFFASGNERTPLSLPPGYGYRVRWYDSWNLLVDLMNHAPVAQTVYFQVTFTYRPPWDPVKPVRPVWLDIDQCGDSKYAIPEGFSDSHWDWSVNVPGKVVAMLGHVHGHGIAVEATNESQGGASICRSTAEADPADAHVIVSMSSCVGDPVAIVQTGEVVRLHSEYQATHAAADVMGIMLAYISRT